MVPFFDLNLQHKSIREELLLELKKVLEQTSFILGPQVDEFEKSFSNFVETSYGIGVNSGTSALQLALAALDVGPGDEVIVPAMTFIATASAVEYNGAKVVLVDVDDRSYTMDPEKLESVITSNTKAIIPVHLYGQPAEMNSILEIANKHGLAVIEDAAQAHGATYKGKKVGSLGTCGCFSFYPSKNLGACGEGGIVVTSDKTLMHKIKVLRDWGQVSKYDHRFKGFNYRMDGFQGAVLNVKLGYLEKWTENRSKIAHHYLEQLDEIKDIAIPSISENTEHVFHIFPLLHKNRNLLQKELKSREIGSAIHYPKSIHQHKCFKNLGYKSGDFPVSEKIGREELSIPLFPEMSTQQINEVVKAIHDAI
jgi:dTDP-4-amino-4,6-dideoxygalactose transaminase